jgi:hypothetical protein
VLAEQSTERIPHPRTSQGSSNAIRTAETLMAEVKVTRATEDSEIVSLYSLVRLSCPGFRSYANTRAQRFRSRCYTPPPPRQTYEHIANRIREECLQFQVDVDMLRNEVETAARVHQSTLRQATTVHQQRIQVEEQLQSQSSLMEGLQVGLTPPDLRRTHPSCILKGTPSGAGGARKRTRRAAFAVPVRATRVS